MDEIMDITVEENDEIAEALEADTAVTPPCEMEVMREELETLRAELARRDAEAAERTLFEELYPGMRREDIPKCVFDEAAARGIPLAAALAIHNRRCEREREHAGAANESNRGRSTGEVRHTSGVSHSFTLEEIRAMTPAQVKRHYRQIMASLGKL